MAGDNKDTRIVQMQFENKDFEKNIAKSQKSLEKFKKDLNFEETSKGLDKFSKSMKNMDEFDSLADNIQKLTDKFTGLGNAGEFVLSRIRRGLESMGDKVISFANSLTTVQAQAGFAKYESLNKAVQTLKSATGKEEKDIYGILDRLTKYTDETSYDFSQGVTSISQLVSSGAASLSKAEKVVEGFYNFAAKAGADTQTASAALQYSWTQSMQRGYLDYANWKELSNRSLGTRDLKETLLETAVAMEKVTKEGDKYYAKSKKGKKVEINTTNLWNDSLQHQWLTADICNAAMLKYADTTTEFGKQAYAAAQRCTTFTDALNAWKDMLATGWMTTYRTVFGDLGDAMQLFSGICNKVSDALGGLVEAKNRMLKSWKGFGGKDSLWGMLIGEFESPDEGIFFEGKKGVLDLITGTGDLITDAFWAMVKDTMSEAEKSQLEYWAGNTEAIMNLLSGEGLLDGATEEELEALREYIDEKFGERGILYGYLGSKLADATAKVQDFIQNVYDWFTVADDKGVTRFEKIKTVVQSIFNTIKFIGQIIGGVFDFIGEIFGEDQLGGAVNSIIDFFSKISGAIIGAENDVGEGGGITEFFHNLAEAVKPLTGFISESVGTITAFFTSLIGGGEKAEGQTNVWEKINEFFATLAGILRNIGQPIIDTITNIFDALRGGDKKAKDGEERVSIFKTLLDVLLKISAVIGKVIKFVGDLISGFITWGKESGFFAKVWETIKTVIATVWDLIKKITAPFLNFFGKIGDVLTDLFGNGFNAESLERAKEGLKAALTGLFGGLGEMIGPIAEKIKEFFKKIFGLFKSEEKEGEESGGLFKRLITWIRTSFAKIPEALSKLGDAFKQNKGTTTFFEAIGIVLDEIKQLFIKFRDALGVTNVEAALVIVAAVGLVVLIFKIVSAVKRLGEGMRNLGSGLKKFSLFGNNGSETPGDKMLKMAIALGILATAVYVLGNMPWQNAVLGLAAMGAIVLAMSMFVKSMSKSMKDVNWKSAGMMALAMISLGIAVNKMLPALQALSKMNPTEYQQALVGIISILATIALFFYTAGKLDIDFKKVSGMIPLAIGIWLLVKTLAKVADMPIDKIKMMAYSLAAIMGSIMLVGLAVRKAPKHTFRDIGLMVAGIALLVFSLKSLANMSDGQLIQMGKGFAGLIAGLLVLTLGIATINKKIGGMKDAGLKQLAYAAAAMAILVFALKPMADMGDGQLLQMGKAFAGLIAGLLILTFGLAKINEHSVGLKGSGLGTLLVAALGMWAIIMALKPVADMEWSQLGKMGATFGVLIAGLLVLVGGMRLIQSKLGGGMKKSISFTTLIALVIGIIGLIKVLQPVANMEWEQLGKMGTAFMVLITGLTFAIGTIQKTASGIGKSVGTLVTLGSLIGGLAIIINLMSTVGDFSNTKIKRILVTFSVFILGLTVAATSLQKNANSIGKAFSTLVELSAFVVAMAALVKTFESLSRLSWLDLGKVIVAFTVMVKGLASSVKTLSENSADIGESIGTILMLAGVVGAIWMLTQALAPLADLRWGEMAKIGIGFTVMLIGLKKATASLMEMSEDADESGIKGTGKVLLALAGLCGTMYVLSHALVRVKDIKLGTIIGFTAGLSIMMMAFAKSSQWMSNANAKGALIGLLAIVAGLAAVMGIIGLIGPWMFDSLSNSLPAFGEALAALGEAIRSFGQNITGLDSGKVETAVSLIHGIAKVQLALTGENISLAVFSALTGQDIKKGDLLAFGKDMAAVGEFVAQFGDAIKDTDLTNVGPAADALNKIAAVQQSLTWENIELAIFSKLVGNEIQAGNLEAFAKDILAIAPMLKSIGDEFKETDFTNFSKAAEALNVMGEVRKSMTWENIELAIFSSLTGQNIQAGNLTLFAEDILAVAPMLKSIGDEFKETDFTNFAKAAEALNVMGEVRKSMTWENIELAIFSSLTGQNIEAGNLEKFGKDILAIAPMLKTVGDEFKDTDFTNFGKAAEAMKAIASVQKALTGENIELAIFKALTGQDIQAGDMEKFGSDVLAIAPTLSKVSDELKDTNFDNIGKAGDALKAFAEIQKVLTDEEIKTAFANIILKPFGQEVTPASLKEFGDDIIPLGEAMAKFAKAVSYVEMEEGKVESINTDGFKAAVSAIEVLGDLQKELPNVGGLFDWITGHQATLPEFASGLGSLGQGIRNIYEEVYKIKDEKAPSISEIQDLANFVSGLGDLLLTVYMYDEDIADFSFTHFANELKKIVDLSDPSNTEDIKIMADFLSSIADASEQFRHFPSVDSIYDVLEELAYDTKLVNKMKETGDAISEKISEGILSEDAVLRIQTAVRGLMGKITGGLADAMFYDTLNLNELLNAAFGDTDDVDISGIINVLDTKVTEAGENEQWSFRDVGFYLAAGIAVGVSSGTYLIENACRVAVQKARDAAMNEADSNSPSLVFAEIGGFLSQGMAIGITDGQGEVEHSMTALTDSVINEATTAMATFSSLMSQDIDANPTITPVLDLSNVKSGASYINGVLAGNRGVNLSIGVAGDYASNAVPRSGRTTGEYRGTDLSGITSKVNELGTRITALGNQISNLQIVMDSGELVGSISGGVSSKIGRKSTYNRRRNA